MRYGRTVRGTFVSRPNRFVAQVEVDGSIETVHVKNTGRCREILVPGATVVLEDSGNPGRKTRYDLIAAYKDGNLINIDSQAPNRVFSEYLSGTEPFGPEAVVRPECTHGDSRFDFYIEAGGRRIFAEVKGVTQETDRICMFPDAPTERGRKHLRGLEGCVSEGYEAYAVFVVQMAGMRVFTPNRWTDPAFAEALEHAVGSGVRVMCLGCDVEPDSLRISHEVPLSLVLDDVLTLRLRGVLLLEGLEALPEDGLLPPQVHREPRPADRT